MFAQKFDFDEYEKFFSDTYLIEKTFPVGKGMVLQNDAMIGQLAKKCIVNFMEIGGRYYFVAYLNSAGLLRSELGNQVLNVHKNANFSMIYAHDPYFGSTAISYRSLDDRSDSTEISKINGGGGHRNASGASIPFKVDNPQGRVIDAYRTYYMLENLYSVNKNGKIFLLLNTACTGKHNVRYLMQERFVNDEGLVKNKSRTDKNLPGFQEGLFCMRNRTNDQNLDEVYSGAITWHYDGFNDRYDLTAKFLPDVLNVDALKNFASPDLVSNSDPRTCFGFKDLKNCMYMISYPRSFADNFEVFANQFLK
jgi:hypothetical protein